MMYNILYTVMVYSVSFLPNSILIVLEMLSSI